jgi:histone deacetylase complex regulatory component SIN3
MNNVDAVNRISELFAGHPDLLQGFEIFVPQGNRIECGSSNEPNTICATGDPIATNSNNDAMYSNPLLESDTGTPELVQGVNQLLLANTGSSVETIVHKQTDTSVSVLATLGNDQDVLASSNNIIRDVSMPFC